MTEKEEAPKELTAEQKSEASDLMDRLHGLNGRLGAMRQSARWNPAVMQQLIQEMLAILADLAALFGRPKPAA